MKHFRFLIFSSLLMLLLNGGSTRAQNTVSLTPDIITHITLLPESASAEGIKIAATWWLPDWQNAMSQRLSDNSQPDSGSDQNCARYGYIQECETPKVGSGIVRPLEGLTCYRSCTCPASYQYDDSNCSGMKQPAGGSCNGQYLECRCPETFIYNQTNCKDEYKLAGDTCDGLYDQCIPRPCSDGGYLEAEDQDKTCNKVTYGGRTCYACREKIVKKNALHKDLCSIRNAAKAKPKKAAPQPAAVTLNASEKPARPASAEAANTAAANTVPKTDAKTCAWNAASNPKAVRTAPSKATAFGVLPQP